MDEGLRERLRADRSEPLAVDVEDLIETGLRRRRRRRGLVATVTLVAVMAIGGLVSQLPQLDEGPPEIVDRPTGATTPPTPEASVSPTPTASDTTAGPASPGFPTVSPAGLGVDVFWPTDGTAQGDGRVEVVRADGSSRTLPIESPNAARVAMVPDGEGGVVWQPGGGAGGSAGILHVDAGGSSSMLMPSTGDMSETFRLVGSGEGEVLVERRRGSTWEDATVDLLAHELATGDERVLTADVEGRSILAAAALEVAVWAEQSDEQYRVVVDGPDRDPMVVHTADGDAPVLDLALGAGDTVDVLVGGDQPRLLQFDTDTAEQGRQVAVPVAPGTDGLPPGVLSLSAADGVVVVNGQDDQSRWLSPLVLDSGGGTWRVLDRHGRALVGRSTVAPTGPPPCAADTDLREAPPTTDGSVSLYLACPDQRGELVTSVYRRYADVEGTGDVATDARAVLELLLDGAPPWLQTHGYTGLDRTTSGGRIEVDDVTLDGTTLVVDFGFPDGGIGNYSTTSGGMYWHVLLTANLLQFDQVQQVELRADGTCDYGRYFESSGCRHLDRSDAPWDTE